MTAAMGRREEIRESYGEGGKVDNSKKKKETQRERRKIGRITREIGAEVWTARGCSEKADKS